MRIRPTVAAVDLDALRHNLGVAWGLVGPDCAVLAAVKGDAYGHGAVRCALALSSAPEPQERVDWFGVALVEEGAQLRAAGISTPILCLGGVGRFGADEVVHLGLVPVDSADGHFVLEQARRYAEALKTLRARGYAPRLRHTCNSGGLVAEAYSRGGLTSRKPTSPDQMYRETEENRTLASSSTRLQPQEFAIRPVCTSTHRDSTRQSSSLRESPKLMRRFRSLQVLHRSCLGTRHRN